MAAMIGQAFCDKRGCYVGEQAGNQSGTELSVRTYWNKPRDRGLIRFKNAAKTHMRAEAMRGVVGNMNICYDRAERSTILPAAMAVGLMLSAIAKTREYDRSSLTGICGIAA